MRDDGRLGQRGRSGDVENLGNLEKFRQIFLIIFGVWEKVRSQGWFQVFLLNYKKIVSAINWDGEHWMWCKFGREN